MAHLHYAANRDVKMNAPANLTIELSRAKYDARCEQRWLKPALSDAKKHWDDWREMDGVLVEAMVQFKRNPGQEDLTGKFHNPDCTLTNFLWNLQLAIEPDRSCLRPLLDFEERYQTIFLRRGLVIYCTMILEALSTEWRDENQLLLRNEQLN